MLSSDAVLHLTKWSMAREFSFSSNKSTNEGALTLLNSLEQIRLIEMILYAF